MRASRERYPCWRRGDMRNICHHDKIDEPAAEAYELRRWQFIAAMKERMVSGHA